MIYISYKYDLIRLNITFYLAMFPWNLAYQITLNKLTHLFLVHSDLIWESCKNGKRLKTFDQI